jgi:hypothetical protein
VDNSLENKEGFSRITLSAKAFLFPQTLLHQLKLAATYLKPAAIQTGLTAKTLTLAA